MIRQDIKEMLGQMVMVGFKEAHLAGDPPVLKALRDFSLGGVILFNIDLPCYLQALKKAPSLSRAEASRICPRNILSQSQLSSLTAVLKGLSKIPPLIAVDMEGGLVSRLTPTAGFPEVPSPKELGEKDDLQETLRAAATIAESLKASGINLNLAPVVDLDLNPLGLISRSGRSFGSDPEKVYRHAKTFIEAHRGKGIFTTLKHFPGKGSASEDTHFEMADVTQKFKQIELEPFARLIAEGFADLVMTSHIHHRAWDKEFPVTLSEKILRGLLRKKLGYLGVIISDDLQMGAIMRKFSLEEASVLAVNAGVDILLASNNTPEGYDPDLFYRLFEALCRAVDQGRIPVSRIEEAHQRVINLKKSSRN